MGGRVQKTFISDKLGQRSEILHVVREQSDFDLHCPQRIKKNAAIISYKDITIGILQWSH